MVVDQQPLNGFNKNGNVLIIGSHKTTKAIIGWRIKSTEI